MVRAQSGLEFITGVTIMLVIYVLAIGAYSYYTENNILEDTFAEHLCYKFSEGVNAAVIGGDGFSINLSVPYKVYSEDLTSIQVSDDYTATVEWESRITSCSIITNNITDIEVYSGKISATNIDGGIYLTSLNTNGTEFDIGDMINITAKYVKGSQVKIYVINSTGQNVDEITVIPDSSSSETVSYDYHESPDQSSTSGNWLYGVGNLTDGDWSTNNTAPLCSSSPCTYNGYLYVNYSKPMDANRTYTRWVAKDCDTTRYLTVPASCWSQSNLQFRVNSGEFRIGPSSLKSYEWGCWNGTNWQCISPSCSSGPPYYMFTCNNIYEEGMNWSSVTQVTDYASQINYGLDTTGYAPGVYTIRTVCTDYPNMASEREVNLR
jgi:hypothetical protein